MLKKQVGGEEVPFAVEVECDFNLSSCAYIYEYSKYLNFRGRHYVFIGVNAEGLEYWLDRTEPIIKDSNGLITFNQLVFYNKDGINEWHSVGIIKGDCQKETDTVIFYSDFDDRGMSIHSESTPNNTLMPNIPNTIGDSMLEYVCRLAWDKNFNE